LKRHLRLLHLVPLRRLAVRRRATAHQRLHRPVDQGFVGQAIWIRDRTGQGGATGKPVGCVTGEWLFLVAGTAGNALVGLPVAPTALAFPQGPAPRRRLRP
jgi:hypothetical protein